MDYTIKDADVYWWLAYSWDNLLFSCVRCNDQAHKGNRFPVRSPVEAPVRGGAIPVVHVEGRLLLDPASDNPSDHFRWEPADSMIARPLWTWRVRARTPEGAATAIDVLRLDEIGEDVGDHVRRNLLERVERVEAHLAAGRFEDAEATWDRLLSDYLDDPTAPLRAATWHALAALVPDAGVYGLRIPRDPYAL